LISYKLGVNKEGSDNLSQGTGYFGIDTSYNIKHLNTMISLDKTFTRTTSGTDIYVSAFKTTGEDDFRNNIIAEVLDGFLIAIWQGKLEIIVNGYHINTNTLNTIIDEYKKSLNDNTVMCYDLLSDPNTAWFQIPVSLSGTMPLGAINFGFKLRYDGTNKVSMIRSSGMKILDKTNLCPSLRFVGLATIEGDSLNNLLRSLENPSHNKWEPQRSPDPAVARNLLRDMYNSLTEKLNEVASNTFDDQVDIEGAGDYLPDELEDNNNNQQERINNNESLNKIISIETKVIEKPKSIAHLETDEIGEDIQSTQDAEGTQSEGFGFEGLEHLGSKPSGSGEREFEDIGMLPSDSHTGEEQIMVKAKEMRIFCLNKKEQWYRLIFTPTASSIKGFIAIQKIAEQNEKMPVKIISVKNSELEFSRNKIGYFKFEENKQVIVDFRIKGEEYSTMEVKLYAYKG